MTPPDVRPTPGAPRLRAVIVDDEEPARRLLRRFLEREPDFEVVGEAGDGESAVEVIRAAAPHVVFLDIQMPAADGFDVVAALRPDELPEIVFVTAYDQYALRAFEAHALDYLLKPFDEDRFAATLARLRRRQQPDPDAAERLRALLGALQRPPEYLERIAVPLEPGRMLLQPVDEIEWLEADRKLVHLHVGRTRRTIRESIGRMESLLDPARFMRVSRSAIVNVRAVREVQTWFAGDYLLVLASGAKVATTRGYRDRIRGMLGRAG